MTGLFIERQVVSALEEWTTGSSQVLCIVGPSLAADQSPTSLIASELIGSAAQSQIPTVSFFCELPHKKLPEGRTAEVEALIALTYLLIRQLIELLPIQHTSTTHLCQQVLELLDGSLETWEVAMVVLGELLDLSPPMLFCVIDNFQELDHKSTKRYMRMLLKALRGHTEIASTANTWPDRVLKILFTTAGSSRCLLTHLSNDELVFAEKSSSARRAGKPGPGRRSLSPSGLEELQQGHR